MSSLPLGLPITAPYRLTVVAPGRFGVVGVVTRGAGAAGLGLGNGLFAMPPGRAVVVPPDVDGAGPTPEHHSHTEVKP